MTELAAPMCLSLDLSLACNLTCRTCRCPDIDARVGSPVLSAEAACRAIEEFAAMGGQEVAIYGGEPLLVKHVYDVLGHATRVGLRTEITTNGLALTPANAARLISVGLGQATVSIDGDEIGHERIRGPGTFARAIRGARALLDAAHAAGRPDFPLDLHATISRSNADAFVGLVRHAADLGPAVTVSISAVCRLDPGATRDAEQALGRAADPRRNHWDLPDDVLIRPEQIPAIRAGVEETRRLAAELDVRVWIDPALGPALDPDRLPRGRYHLTRLCTVFETCLHLGPDGVIGSCPMLTHFEFGRLGVTSLAEVWRGAEFARLRGVMRGGYLPVCDGCCVHGALMDIPAAVPVASAGAAR